MNARDGYIPERPEHHNIPVETRTREDTDDTYPVEDYATEAYEVDPLEPREPEPVLVSIVGPIQGDDLTNWSSNSFTVGATVPVQLAGANRNRRKLVIANNGDGDTTVTNTDNAGTDRVTTQANLTGSGNTAEYVIPATGWTDLTFGLNITSITGTTPSVTVKIQETLDGTNWVDLVTFAAATTATYELKKTTTAASNRIRVVWTTSGTITDLDFTVDVMRFPVTRTSTTSAGNYVMLTRGSTDAFALGHRVLAGEQLELTHNDSVWALASSGEVVVSVANEYVVE